MSEEEAVRDAHLVLILTHHNEFKETDFNALSKNMAQKMIFDTRNIISPEKNNEVDVVNLGNFPKYKAC